MLRNFFDFLGRHLPVNNAYVFFGVSALVIGYLLYMMFARRKATVSRGREPEL